MYVGIDIGGTSTRLAQTNSVDEPKLLNKIKFSTSGSFESDFKQIIKYLNKVVKPLVGIGVGIAGRVDPQTFALTHTTNIPQYQSKPFVRMLLEKIKTKIIINNDGIASALAEAYYTLNKGKKFTYITWGTGLAAFTLDYENNKPVAKKIDRTAYYKNWEEEFSGNGIYHLYRKKAEDLSEEEWERIIVPFPEKMKLFIQETNSKKIVFGGGLVLKQWSFLETKLKNLSQELNVSFELTSLGENIGLYGALALLRQEEVFNSNK